MLLAELGLVLLLWLALHTTQAWLLHMLLCGLLRLHLLVVSELIRVHVLGLLLGCLLAGIVPGLLTWVLILLLHLPLVLLLLLSIVHQLAQQVGGAE